MDSEIPDDAVEIEEENIEGGKSEDEEEDNIEGGKSEDEEEGTEKGKRRYKTSKVRQEEKNNARNERSKVFEKAVQEFDAGLFPSILACSKHHEISYTSLYNHVLSQLNKLQYKAGPPNT